MPRVERKCRTCGSAFIASPGNKAFSQEHYCSLKCVHLRNHREPVVNEDGTATIPLTKGYEAVIDVEDLPKIERTSWQAHPHRNTVYARSATSTGVVYMHRLINQTPDGLVTDHIDWNGLNNRKRNLRSVSSTENLNHLSPEAHSTRKAQ